MAATVSMPKLGFDMAEGTLIRWLRAEGEAVRKGDVLAEIETDKATVEVETSAEGIVRKLLVEAGATVPVGTPIAVIGSRDEKINLEALVGGPAQQAEPRPAAIPAGGERPLAAEASSVPEEPGPMPGPIRASPLARKMAAEGGIDLGRLKGTGPGGRITKRDVQAVQPGPIGSAIPSTAPTPAILGLPPLSRGAATLQPGGREPLRRLRQAIGRRMKESKQQVPHFYVTREFEMGSLLSLRTQVNELLPEQEKLTLNDFLVKAVALALTGFPNLNASVEGGELVRHGSINVGVAVAVEGGLLNVVCRDANRKPLHLLSTELREMIGRAREGKVRSQDVEGSTFTISNLGMFQVENFIAIINPPEAAILALGTIQETAVVEQGQVRVGQRMKATISADHRVTDGVEAARFLQALAAYLERPLQLLV